MSGVTVWGDDDNDGYVDLFVCTAWSTTATHTRNSLFHNNGDGSFVRVEEGPVATSAGNTQWAVWSDYDGDGQLDLLLSYLQNSVRLFHNEGLGQFTEIKNSTLRQEFSSAGAAWGDFDNDGDLDLCLVSYFGNLNIFKNEGDGAFARTILSPQGNYQCPNWVDYDNDGHLDLFVPEGTAQTHRDHLFHNTGNGAFTQVTMGSIPNEGGYSWGGAWADFDNNGFQDLLVMSGYATNVANLLYRNNGNDNAWLILKLVGTVSNRAAIGAKVRVRARIANQIVWQLRELCRGGSLQDDLRAHFGLGDAARADVIRIEWPSGIVQELKNIPVRQILTVTEPPALEALGEGRIRILCWSRQNYEVEATDDLQTWTSLGVVATDRNRPVVLDPGAAGRPHRFYRAKEQ